MMMRATMVGLWLWSAVTPLQAQTLLEALQGMRAVTCALARRRTVTDSS